jgi:hypothetical protein
MDGNAQDPVAGRLWLTADHRQLVPYQSIKEGAFPGIGSSEEGDVSATCCHRIFLFNFNGALIIFIEMNYKTINAPLLSYDHEAG